MMLRKGPGGWNESIRDLTVEWLPIKGLRANPRNARTHSKRQLQALAGCIREVGFTNPVIVDEDGMILAGHGRVAAAALLGLDEVPVIRIGTLSEAQKRAYVLADNKLAERAGWDRDMLAVELGELSVLLPNFELSVELTGFEVGEIDVILADREEKAQSSRDDDLEPAPETPVSRVGDLWILGRHRILCADARDPASFEGLLGDERADMVFTDPPDADANGKTSDAELRNVLALVLGHAVRVSREGALHYVAADWRHIADLVEAGKGIYAGLCDLCVWTKSNGGPGPLYRSRHELVAVFEVGGGDHMTDGDHKTIVERGRRGRNRSNVWSHAAVTPLEAGRREELASYPTVKPVALVADAIEDVTSRHAVVLDLFGGTGTTLVAAERTGRRARLIEIEPRWVDVTIRRFEALTKSDAVHAPTGRTFAEEAALRARPVH